MVVGERDVQTFEIVVVMLLFLFLWVDVFVLRNAHPLLFLDK